MPKELKQSLLEIEGVIRVESYKGFNDKGTIKCKCSNCEVKIDYGHNYILKDESKIMICYYCNKKVHNENASNLKFKKNLS
ncbi:hypothetical protein LX97_01871 [Nonlabens dokdonensis]|jgi:aspartate carbamoyltransferase regulatory subunit|uniref:Uncharacterized protein n=1 Tax=Nonlabens dokdonensis TaxID=328515 RepID=A0ABX5PZA1_9FLAO|nr:hypothetical protein LX97_01871 [Nonlabens dokdonensis]